jgi:serine/threonine-protein kinase
MPENGRPQAVEMDSSPAADSGDIGPAHSATAGTLGQLASTAFTWTGAEMLPGPSPVLDRIAQMAAGMLAPPDRVGKKPLPVVAGYELLGPLGRGGMSIVYQARQVKLGRMVALKMILGGAHARPGDLARFRAEAEAVARLQHPHIIQIYEVGEQDGWAYFALEVVPGGSLARELAGRPQPVAPSARLVETLARTMAFAHERGIVHRDLKPANILLAGVRKDGEAPSLTPDPWPLTPKISDFGLAKRLDAERPTATAAGRTRAGELLGTPSYMAPEQTTGRSAEVGPAADVYALGAILYECLTGRPPFQAATPLDIIFQVRTEEPVPPRRLVPSVPRDLNTICLKCLEKEPRRRYSSAAAFADDLRRFLSGARVHARSAGPWERTVRWARRKKTMAAILAVSSIAVLIVLTLGVWHYTRLREYNAALATERNTADRHFQGALAAVKQMLVRVSEDDDKLYQEPGMELVRRKLLEDALQFYEGFLKETSNDAVREETAHIYCYLGDLEKRLGHPAAAEKAYSAASVLYHGLATEFPQQPTYRLRLAGCYTNLANALVKASREKEAEDAYRQAVDIQQTLVQEFPESGKYRSALAGNHHNLGTLLSCTGRLAEAEETLRRALDERQRLADEFPEMASYRRDCARTLSNLADVLDRTDRPGDAEQSFRRARDIQEQLVKSFPREPDYREELAGSHHNLGMILNKVNRYPEAETEYGHAIRLQQQLVEDFPKVPAYLQELARCHHCRGLLLENWKRPGEAEQAFRQALDLQQRLADEFPETPAELSWLGYFAAHLASWLFEQERLAEAKEQVERAVRSQQAALKLRPTHPLINRRLGQHYRVLAETLVRLGDHSAAAQAAAEHLLYIPNDEKEYLRVAELAARCVTLAEDDETIPDEKRKALAKAYGDQAIALLRQRLLHRPSPSVAELKASPSFAPLRLRADFQELVHEPEK